MSSSVDPSVYIGDVGTHVESRPETFSENAVPVGKIVHSTRDAIFTHDIV